MTWLTVWLAPAAAFAVVVLFATGLYRTANHSGLIARKRLAVFSPASTPQALPFNGASPLLKRQRFSSIGLLDRFLRSRAWSTRTSLDLARAALPLRVGEYVLIRAIAAVAMVLLARNAAAPLLLSVGFGAIGYMAPVLVVRYRQTQRVRQFDDQLVDSLVLIANALKSGYSFLQGMESVAREMPDPIGAEFEQALSEIRMGGAVEDGLIKIAERVRSTDFELVVTAMIIQRQVGGNLTEILTTIATTVRDRHRILREVRVLTAQERMSGYVVAALPVALVLLLTVSSPGYITQMWDDPAGKLILGLGGGLEVLGLLVIKRLVDVDV